MSKNFNKKKESKNYEDDWEEKGIPSKKPKKVRQQYWEEEDDLDEETRYFLSKIRKK
jgi:hypothetical protein